VKCDDYYYYYYYYKKIIIRSLECHKVEKHSKSTNNETVKCLITEQTKMTIYALICGFEMSHRHTSTTDIGFHKPINTEKVACFVY